MPEYNPLEEDKTSSTPPASAPSPQLGEGYDKALNSERTTRKALEKEKAQLLAMVAEKDRQLEQATMTLEEKYRQESEQYKQSLLTEAQQAIAERDRKLQEIEEARQISEQRAALLEQQRAIAAIQTGFSQTFEGLLVNPRKVSAYMAEIADDLTIDPQGNPALILRDRSGEPTGLAPLEQAIGYFQRVYPEDFKPPSDQKKGGGFRNLANTGIPRTGNSQELELPPMGKITAEQFLANREAIAKGQFKVVKE